MRDEGSGGAGVPTVGEDVGGEAQTTLDTRVPVQVAARTADRLEEAEATIEALTARVAELEAALEASVADRDAMSRAHEIEFAALRSGAIDTEAVTLLAAASMEGTGATAEEAVAAIASSRPYLFGQQPTGAASPVRAARGVASMPVPHADPALELSAREAGQSGDRGALLRYLRLRRSAL